MGWVLTSFTERCCITYSYMYLWPPIVFRNVYYKKERGHRDRKSFSNNRKFELRCTLQSLPTLSNGQHNFCSSIRKVKSLTTQHLGSHIRNLQHSCNMYNGSCKNIFGEFCSTITYSFLLIFWNHLLVWMWFLIIWLCFIRSWTFLLYIYRVFCFTHVFCNVS
jgi:hypothetical protein